MIERHDIAHRPDAQPLGARAGADRIETWRRHPALVGPEMMLDAEGVIETDIVAQSELAPELLVALMRRHAGLGPDMGKMREFHRNEPIDRVVRSKRPSPSGKLLIAYGVRTQETLARNADKKRAQPRSAKRGRPPIILDFQMSPASVA